jgi:hypothetical protein
LRAGKDAYVPARRHELRAAFILVEILLPQSGNSVGQKWFENLLKELTGKFSGATSFQRVPGQGLWRSGGETQRDHIAVIEVMADARADRGRA